MRYRAANGGTPTPSRSTAIGRQPMDSKGKNIVDFGSARKNLRLKDKDAAREAKERQAAENRARFGRTSAQKRRDKLEEARRRKQHDNHERDPKT